MTGSLMKLNVDKLIHLTYTHCIVHAYSSTK